MFINWCYLFILFFIFRRILSLTYTVLLHMFLIYTNILYMYIGVFLKKLNKNNKNTCVNFNSLKAYCFNTFTFFFFFYTFVHKLGYSIHEYTLKSKLKFSVL